MAEREIAIIGGGPGGYVAALRAAQLRKKVTVIEEDRGVVDLFANALGKAEGQARLERAREPAETAGVASYTMFARPNEDETKVRERLTREGYYGAIVSRTVAVDKSKTYVPPQAHIVPGPFVGLPYYGSFYGYYPWAYHTYVTPGYMLDTTRILIETLVYRLPNGKPVWSGVTESINPDSSLDLVKELVRILRAELQKEQLLVGG